MDNKEDTSIQMFTRQKQYIMMLILVCSTTLGVFLLLAALLFVGIPAANKDMLANILPIIVTAWVGIVLYFFSTSASSANKDDKPIRPVL